MKKTDIDRVALYFATRNKDLLTGIELPNTVKSIIDSFDDIEPENKSVLNSIGNTDFEFVFNGVKWVKNKINNVLKR